MVSLTNPYRIVSRSSWAPNPQLLHTFVDRFFFSIPMHDIAKVLYALFLIWDSIMGCRGNPCISIGIRGWWFGQRAGRQPPDIPKIRKTSLSRVYCPSAFIVVARSCSASFE